VLGSAELEIIFKAQNVHIDPDYWGIQKSSTNLEIEHGEAIPSLLCNWTAEIIGAPATLYLFIVLTLK